MGRLPVMGTPQFPTRSGTAHDTLLNLQTRGNRTGLRSII